TCYIFLYNAQKWLSLQTDAFRGHGLSLLTRKIQSLRGSSDACCSRDEQDVLVSELVFVVTDFSRPGVAVLRYSHALLKTLFIHYNHTCLRYCNLISIMST